MAFRYQGTWSHLNGEIMAFAQAGKGAREIVNSLTGDRHGRFGDNITELMVDYIIKRNRGETKPPSKTKWQVWTPEKQEREFQTEYSKEFPSARRQLR